MNASLDKYLTPSRTLILQAATKADALRELAAALCRDEGELQLDEVLRAILDREQSVSSRIAPRIALPHAVVPGCKRQILAVGYRASGIPWDSPMEPPVTLVVMSICGETQAEAHVQMLAALARTLRDPAAMARLSSASSSSQLYQVLLQPPGAAAVTATARSLQAGRSLVRHACAMVEESHATALMILAEDAPELDFLHEENVNVRLILVTDDRRGATRPKSGTVLAVPFQNLQRTHRVKLAFLFALSHGLIDKGDIVVCLSGNPATGLLHSLEIVNVSEEFNVLLSLRSQLRATDIRDHVLDRVLHIATALAREGREGKPVGAIFVLGDYENVQQRCHQLVMNPFKGYPEGERNILDPGLEETIKEFSRIDGAFLIRGDGVIMSVGSYIQTGAMSGSLESGLGARHAAALAITLSTRALSTVISESTRRISLFKQGQRVMALDQALR